MNETAGEPPDLPRIVSIGAAVKLPDGGDEVGSLRLRLTDRFAVQHHRWDARARPVRRQQRGIRGRAARGVRDVARPRARGDDWRARWDPCDEVLGDTAGVTRLAPPGGPDALGLHASRQASDPLVDR
ncbi:MAG TPA: hypothetical protein VEF89_30520 [Solirubrobacteraceae bacterium]|nr:hypothetical protein [Solirubrobacteraceae bacterium]